MSKTTKLSVGVDLGDKQSVVCVLDDSGEVVKRFRARTRSNRFGEAFLELAPSRIAMEAGSHSRWASRMLASLGHEVYVANPREVRLIHGSHTKNDRLDAEKLARLVRVDPKLLSPVRHRGDGDQAVWTLLNLRDRLVQCRTKLVNFARGAVKPFGCRLPKCSVEMLARRAREALAPDLLELLEPALEAVEELTRQIRGLDRKMEGIAEKRYPVTEPLRQPRGVGLVTSLAYVVVIGDPGRFSRSRQVGSYVGLRPSQDQSGEREVPRRITKAGNGMVRRLLLQAAHYTLGPFGEDSDLRRFGERIAARGGKVAKRKAVVAVARKLAVLLHRLWVTGEIYDPLRVAKRRGEV